MQVYLGNVPQDLTEELLREELQPFMEALEILPKSFDCHKPRRKPHAFLTFLYPANAEKFLKRYAHAFTNNTSAFGYRHALPGASSQLEILKSPIKVSKGKHEADKSKLKHLEFEVTQNRNIPGPKVRHAPLSCRLTSISCGKNKFVGKNKILAYQERSKKTSDLNVTFHRRSMSIVGEVDFTEEKACPINRSILVSIPYDTLQDLVIDKKCEHMTLIMNDPPRFYSVSKWMTHDIDINVTERGLYIHSWEEHKSLTQDCLVYRLKANSAQDMHRVFQDVSNRRIVPFTRYDIPMIESKGYERDFASLLELMNVDAGVAILPFTLLFQLQALFWNNYLDFNGCLELFEAIKSVFKSSESNESLDFAVDIVGRLFQTIPFPCPGISPEELEIEHIMDEMSAQAKELRNSGTHRDKLYGKKLPDNQAWVFKAMITPTRILLVGPEPESKNRVLRKFSAHIDHFLRVIFCDEDGQDLRFNFRFKNDAIFARYTKVLSDGISIAGRLFQFLGFSHSSLRSHSAWFVAKFVDDAGIAQDCHTILRSLGNFDGICIPARCAARIGQAFSETPFAIPVFDFGIGRQYIKDIKSTDGKRVFSDGIGTISLQALEIIWDHLPPAIKTARPTCLQIRWAGVKGMLSLDTRLTGKIIRIRKESMQKFESNDWTELGICDTSAKPIRMLLNRQMIKIMEDAGTEEDWFIRQQQKALTSLREATSNALNTSHFLTSQEIGTKFGLPNLVIRLDKLRVDYRGDKFLRCVVEHAVLGELRRLKYKASIPVEHGATLFGILDETGYLNEGQVYVSVEEVEPNSMARSQRLVPDGRVLVTRSPALHPGDIQVVNAVTPPMGHSLRDLRNCVVFSQKGQRDLPSQLSGGDLDGDLYNVIWDARAFPKETYPAADYSRVIPTPLDRNVNIQDIAQFFVDFMKTDNLGVIATRHQILADIQAGGTHDIGCIQLAELHSTAVDYSKTGIPVDWTKLPKPPLTRPDFLAPFPEIKVHDLGRIEHVADDEGNEAIDEAIGLVKHKYHKSEKVLGKLFRNIDETNIWNKEIKRDAYPESSEDVIWNHLLSMAKQAVASLFPGSDENSYQSRLPQARKIRGLYESAISDFMMQYSDRPRATLSEVEVFCGSILGKKGAVTRRQRDASIKLRDDVNRVTRWISRLIRDRENQVAKQDKQDGADSDGMARRLQALELSLACLDVGCSPALEASTGSHNSKKELQSFKVVAACCLVKELGSDM